MHFFLILFLIAILGICFLVTRKIILLRKSEFYLPPQFDFTIELPDFEEIKKVFLKKSSKYGYVLLVVTIRLYVLSHDIIKTNARYIAKEIQKKIIRKRDTLGTPVRENKFLKRITAYKKKIRSIKEKIKKEEGLN